LPWKSGSPSRTISVNSERQYPVHSASSLKLSAMPLRTFSATEISRSLILRANLTQYFPLWKYYFFFFFGSECVAMTAHWAASNCATAFAVSFNLARVFREGRPAFKSISRLALTSRAET